MSFSVNTTDSDHFKTSLTRSTASMLQLATNTRARMTGALSNVHTFMASRNKTFWIALGIVATVVMGCVIYYTMLNRYYWNRYIGCPGCYRRYPDQNANIIEREPIDARLLKSYKHRR